MRGFAPILVVVGAARAGAAVHLSNVVLNFLVVALLIALVGQGWNMLGGYGGQYSFGHAAFFGTGAYVDRHPAGALRRQRLARACSGIAAGAVVGAVIGALTFRSGLRGSYFALVTLAFAEVLRIIASVAPITGAGVGMLIKLDLRPEAFQFQSRAPFYWSSWRWSRLSLVIVRTLEDSRFGAWLVAVRENEDAAQALGVERDRGQALRDDASRPPSPRPAAASTRSISCSSMPASPMAPGSRSRRCSRRSSAASAPCSARSLGALVVKTLGEVAKLVTGDVPGLDLVIYGACWCWSSRSRRAASPAFCSTGARRSGRSRTATIGGGHG